MKNLLIITGAGASYDVARPSETNVNRYYKPPLTKELFLSGEQQTTEWIRDCLGNHPFAAQIGKDHNKNNTTLEQYLFDIKNMKSHPTIQEHYFTVPIYLHELFLDISYKYIKSKIPCVPSNYYSLLLALTKGFYTTIIWINLNYDLFADKAITALTNKAFNSFDAYMDIEIREGIKIMYTKPHGSVDWFRKNGKAIPWDEIEMKYIPDNFEESLSDNILTEHMAHTAGLHPKEKWLYPAILPPIGHYEFLYKNHIKKILPALKETTSILCIGFSALDQDVLTLLKENITHVEKMKIVNGDSNSGGEAYKRIKEYMRAQLNRPEHEVAFDGGFSQFVKTDVSEWLSNPDVK